VGREGTNAIIAGGEGTTAVRVGTGPRRMGELLGGEGIAEIHGRDGGGSGAGLWRMMILSCLERDQGLRCL